MLNRRDFSVSIVGACATILGSASAQSQNSVAPFPEPSSLKSGDLIWPKKPGVYVPYEAQSQRGADEDRQAWQNEKQAFMANIEQKAPYMTAADRARINGMTFDEFYSRYVGAASPTRAVPYNAGVPLYVGHVGIIRMDGTDPWVVEAVGAGVKHLRYSDWIGGRPGERIWHGRIRGTTDMERSRTADEALKHVGKPYDFWDFDLNRDAGFYCSKLAWLATFRTLGFGLDGDANSRRRFWLSPKQLLYTQRVQILLDQGPYSG